MSSYIIVPDGIAADITGAPLPRPSFVYRQVLDYIIAIAGSHDTVYLAPANCCNGPSEHELACTYMKENSPRDLQLYCPPIVPANYIDTYGNATLLKQLLGRAITDTYCELVCARIHSYRAEYCFRKAGFTIGKVHRVPYRITGEPIVRRWWYYNYMPIHCVYEIIAFLRDVIRMPEHSP